MLLLRVGRSKSGKNNLYSFANVGFSLRKINLNTSLPCLRIRRDSDSLETDIGYTAAGLVDTAAIAAFCGANSGFVRYWYDQFGTNHASQPTALSQPRIYNSGSQEVNEFGKPAIRFIDPNNVSIGAHLAINAWHTASDPYVGVYSAYSLATAGNFPFIIGSSVLDRGVSVLHNTTYRLMRSYSTRSTQPGTTSSGAVPINTTCIRFDEFDRKSNIRIYKNKDAVHSASTPDSDTDFLMPTVYWFGASDLVGTIESNTLINEIVPVNSSQLLNNLIIRSDMYDFWGA